jgi:hypothetical protein
MDHAVKAIASGLVLLLALTVLAACGSSGPVRRVSEPAANIQQLEVRADGSWSLELRLDNFSSVPMRFDQVDATLAIAGQPPFSLHATPGIGIGPESADVVTLTVVPPAGAKIAVADALARGARVAYHLGGSVRATPDKGSQRTWELDRDNALSPVPGLPGVLR